MTTYAAMVTRIGSEFQRADIDTQIKNAIVTAIAHWGRRRFFFNEARGLWETTSGTRAYAEALSTGSGTVPTVKKTDELKVTLSGSDSALTERPWSMIETITTSTALTGSPTDYAYYANQYWLYPIPNGSLTITHSYIKDLTEVSFSSTGSSTNAWMVTGEELIRQRATAVLKIDVLHNADAKAEAMAMAGSECLSVLESAALQSIVGETVQKASGGGRLTPTQF